MKEPLILNTVLLDKWSLKSTLVEWHKYPEDKPPNNGVYYVKDSQNEDINIWCYKNGEWFLNEDITEWAYMPDPWKELKY